MGMQQQQLSAADMPRLMYSTINKAILVFFLQTKHTHIQCHTYNFLVVQYAHGMMHVQ